MDKAVLIRMRDGDREDFRAVITEFQQPVYSFVLKTLASQDDARDILQETFIRVWQNRSKYNLWGHYRRPCTDPPSDLGHDIP